MNVPFDDRDYFPRDEREAWRNGEAKTQRFELIPFDKIVLDRTPAYLVKGIVPASVFACFGAPPSAGSRFLFST